MRSIRNVAAAAGAAGLLLGAPALASANRYVSHSATVGTKDAGCATAAYTSVQSAVNAASAGETVYLCGATPYPGPVVIAKSLLLAGDPGATIDSQHTTDAADQVPAAELPPSFAGLVDPDVVVAVLGDVNVQIAGLKINGPFANGNCGEKDYGVLALGSPTKGAQLTMNDDSVTDVGAVDEADLGGCQYGVAIQVGAEDWPKSAGGLQTENFVANATIANTTVTGYQKNGITVDGPRSQANINSVTIDGGGQDSSIARNGIQISDGATGQVADSTISDDEYTGTGGYSAATGVLLAGGCSYPLDVGVQVHNDTFTNDDVGVDVGEFNPGCTASATMPTDEQVHDNTIAKNDGVSDHSSFADEAGDSYTGYQVAIADSGDGDAIVDNTISSTDGAFGPRVNASGVFLAPIDIQSYPPIKPQVKGNTYDGRPTNAPYASGGGGASY